LFKPAHALGVKSSLIGGKQSYFTQGEGGKIARGGLEIACTETSGGVSTQNKGQPLRGWNVKHGRKKNELLTSGERKTPVRGIPVNYRACQDTAMKEKFGHPQRKETERKSQAQSCGVKRILKACLRWEKTGFMEKGRPGDKTGSPTQV